MSAAFEDIKQQILHFQSTLSEDCELGFIIADNELDRPIRISHIWEVDSGFIVFYGKIYGSFYQILKPICSTSFMLTVEDNPDSRIPSKRIIFESPY